MNLFGFGPKALFWLRLGAYACQTSVFSSVFADLVSLPHGKPITAAVALLGIALTAIASGTPPTKI